MNTATELLIWLLIVGLPMLGVLGLRDRPRNRKPGKYRAGDVLDGAVIRFHGEPQILDLDLRMDLHPDELIEVISWPPAFIARHRQATP